MNKNRIFGFAALLMSLIMLCAAITASAGSLSKADIEAIVNTTTDASQVTSPFIQAVNIARPGVVGVNNYTITYSYGYTDPYDFFGFGGGSRGYQQPTQKERLAGTGSGVVISSYGHILTNFHVVEDASRVTVFDGEKELDAQVVVFSEEKDLAVLLCPEIKLPAVQLGDSDQLQVGEWAIVIGNPLGEDFFRSVTVGTVSSLERSVEQSVQDKYGRKTTVKNSMIQVDAAINSGNSGGGMFNTLGQLMGIPSLKYSANYYSSASIDNIGMCIPINVAKPLIAEALEKYDADAVREQLEKKAKDEKIEILDEDQRPRMGVTVATLNSYVVSQGILPNGAYVTAVEEGSPAQEAGIQVGDIIVDIDGEVITNSNMMVTFIQDNYKAGDVIQVKVYRAENIQNAQTVGEIGDGEYIDLTVTLKIIGEQPAA
ncbi:MAG: trypsin-like peptidase domain-containing protein [Clostridia bacterium]|nr:trypsin-like peptidase domain-containing protein [Clostridia bacterium]